MSRYSVDRVITTGTLANILVFLYLFYEAVRPVVELWLGRWRRRPSPEEAPIINAGP